MNADGSTDAKKQSDTIALLIVSSAIHDERTMKKRRAKLAFLFWDDLKIKKESKRIT